MKKIPDKDMSEKEEVEFLEAYETFESESAKALTELSASIKSLAEKKTPAPIVNVEVKPPVQSYGEVVKLLKSIASSLKVFMSMGAQKPQVDVHVKPPIVNVDSPIEWSKISLNVVRHKEGKYEGLTDKIVLTKER